MLCSTRLDPTLAQHSSTCRSTAVFPKPSEVPRSNSMPSKSVSNYFHFQRMDVHFRVVLVPFHVERSLRQPSERVQWAQFYLVPNLLIHFHLLHEQSYECFRCEANCLSQRLHDMCEMSFGHYYFNRIFSIISLVHCTLALH